MAEGNGEPTVVCPNCGALVPIGAPNCFICDEKMPEQTPPKVEEKKEPAPEEIVPSEPAKAPEVVSAPAVEKIEIVPVKPPEAAPEELPAKPDEVKAAPPPEEKKPEVPEVRPATEEAPKPQESPIPLIPETVPAAETKPEERPVAEEKKAEPAKGKPSKKAKGTAEEKKAKEEKKIARLKRAYETGKITKEFYLENLKGLGAPIPVELEESPQPKEEKPPEKPEAKPEPQSDIKTEPEIKEERPPEKTEGKVEAAPIEAARAEEPTGVAAPSETEVKAERLKAAYESGRIPREVYVENLKTLGMAVPIELEKPQEEMAPVEERKIPDGIAEEIEQAAEPPEAEAAVEMAEEVIPEELPAEAEAAAPVEEAAAAPEEVISKGEIEGPEKSYRGVAIASAGGLVYVLVWLLFIPMLGNIVASLLSMLGAILIVVGYNVASSDAAAARRARAFNCPLCNVKLDVSVKECLNCGAKFSD